MDQAIPTNTTHAARAAGNPAPGGDPRRMSALIAAGAADGPFPAGCRVLVNTEDDSAAEGETFLVSRGFTLEGHVIDAADLADIEAGKLTVWGRILRRLPAETCPA